MPVTYLPCHRSFLTWCKWLALYLLGSSWGMAQFRRLHPVTLEFGRSSLAPLLLYAKILSSLYISAFMFKNSIQVLQRVLSGTGIMYHQSISWSSWTFCLIFYLKKARENVYILQYKHPAHVPVYLKKKSASWFLNGYSFYFSTQLVEYNIIFNFICILLNYPNSEQAFRYSKSNVESMT